jgi:hypothetical protein
MKVLHSQERACPQKVHSLSLSGGRRTRKKGIFRLSQKDHFRGTSKPADHKNQFPFLV